MFPSLSVKYAYWYFMVHTPPKRPPSSICDNTSSSVPFAFSCNLAAQRHTVASFVLLSGKNDMFYFLSSMSFWTAREFRQRYPSMLAY